MHTHTPEKHAFGAEVSKVLQLMIHSLYTNKDIFLRELISNASDACDKLRYHSLSEPSLLEDAPQLKITLSVQKDEKTITIADNGIGMSREELIANLGTIAKSGTQEFLNALSGDSKKDIPLIGQFGVGFYSAFVVADSVTVTSRKAGETTGHRWASSGAGEFTIEPLPSPTPRGTSITLHIREEDKEYLDKYRLRHITQTYSDHIAFPIEFIENDGKTELFNTAAALWTRPKQEISDEQYKEFYHHVAHSPDAPWMVLHNKAEGMLEYTNLLFIPSLPPFDLFHPDRKRRVKLYVKRVFITEEGTDLIPHYLRFLRGVIDSEDLPLNISRETLQKNPLLDRIRDSVCKRVLSELKKRAEKSAEEYAPFWQHFGAVLKEGLCEAIAPKEQILEACRFYSLNRGALIGLDDYVASLKQGQEHIFYLTGDSVEKLASSPQVEGFRKRGIDVLLLTDHVDDFWVNVVHEYKKHPLKSVTRSNIDLDAIEKLPEADKETEQAAAGGSELETLLQAMKSALGDAVRDVRITHKLTDSPVCLSVEEGAMDIRLERFLREQKQIQKGIAKIMEINPSHPIIRTLAGIAATSNGAENATLKDASLLLLDQARIIEGDDIADPAGFSLRISRFMSQGLLSA